MDSVSKKTLVIGASPKPERYSNKAIKKLLDYGHQVYSIGLREDVVNGVKIETGLAEFKEIDTVTMYIGKQRQNGYLDYILKLKPQRVIFNPGSENPEFVDILESNETEVIEHCTLVTRYYGLF